MKRTFYLSFLVFLALGLSLPQESQAQDRINWDKVLKDWSAGIHVGATMPYTDVRSYDWFRKTKPVSEYQYGFGANITKMMGGVFGIQARYTYGKLQGYSNFESESAEDVQFWQLQNANGGKPFYFSTNFHSPSINVYMNFSNMFMALNRKLRADSKEKELKERRVSIYGRVGIGAVWFDTELHNLADDAPAIGKQYGRGFSGATVEMAFPFAMGMKVKVNKFIDVNIEGEFTFVHDDKLDAYIVEDLTKDDYILDIDNIPSDRIRGSLGGRHDKYLFVNAGVLFKFGSLKSQEESVEWVNPVEAYMDANDAKVQYLLDNMYEVKDADGDGVIDELDEEPNTPEGATVDTKGNTLDSDGDGFPDYEDPEPFSSPGLEVDADGKNVYPETWTPTEIKEYVLTTIETAAPKSAGWALSMIFFDTDASKIKAEMIPSLYEVATVMKKYPDMTVNVKGHTDVRYTDEYNMKLSDSRTAAAIDYMVENYGIARDRFVPGYFGEKENLFPNAKRAKEHLLNRRVEFTPANY